MADDLVRAMRATYHKNLLFKGGKVNKAAVLDVSNLKPDGSGASMEPDNPRGDRFCFKTLETTVCANNHEQLDLAEKLIKKNELEIVVAQQKAHKLYFNSTRRKEYKQEYKQEDIPELPRSSLRKTKYILYQRIY